MWSYLHERHKRGFIGVPLLSGVFVFLGAMIGHDMPQGQLTMPIGVFAEMDADAGLITLLEAAVISNKNS